MGVIHVTQEHHVSVVTIDDAERYNAMSLSMWIDLKKAFDNIEAETPLCPDCEQIEKPLYRVPTSVSLKRSETQKRPWRTTTKASPTHKKPSRVAECLLLQPSAAFATAVAWAWL